MFEPRNPDYADAIRIGFERQAAMKLMGITLCEVSPGRVVLEMPFAQKLTQQAGFVHGGILTSALDSACGFAALSLQPPGKDVLTIEFKTNFLSPGEGACFRFLAEVIKPGRRISVVEAEAMAGQHGEAPGPVLTKMTATMMAVDTE
jgi:uncharacterized protein (TIGR00369 family)